MAEKTYINGIYLKKKDFDNGGIAINASFNVDKFIEELKKHKNDRGYANIVFKNRKEADEKGNNMYAELDTYGK